MSVHARRKAEEKVHAVIDIIAEHEGKGLPRKEQSEAEADMKLLLEGVAKIAFGIWTSLDRIAAAINNVTDDNDHE